MIPMTFGAAEQWDALLYGERSQSTINYLASQFDTAKNLITDAGKQFFNQAYTWFSHANGSDAIDFARKVVSGIDNHYMSDRIQALTSLEQLRSASPTMQRWIMAEPTIRRRYAAQACEGYSDTYTDHRPDLIGEKHIDWRLAMNGMLQNPDEDVNMFVTYIDDLPEDQRELTFLEKIDIATTWAAVRGYMEEGSEDPTSPSGGKL